MREIYLIARREYLAYVAAWGFWLSLLTAPLLLTLFAVGPMLAGQAEPTRALAVIAADPKDAEAQKAGAAARADLTRLLTAAKERELPFTVTSAPVDLTIIDPAKKKP